MKTTIPHLTVVSLALLLGLAASPSLSAAPQQPHIRQITFDDGGLVVVVDVPDGVARVVLEGSKRGVLLGWMPRAVQRVKTSGPVTFRLSREAAVGMEMFRARADDKELLPASFFSGRTEFEGSLQGANQGGGPGTIYFRGNDGEVVNVAPSAGNPNSATDSDALTIRTVAESDLWKLQGNILYVFNQSRGLQVIDVTNLDAPVLRGTLPLPASGEDLYVLNDTTVVLLARAQPCDWNASGAQESVAIVVEVTDGSPREVARVPVPGRILESRLVGTALYVATESWQPRSEPTEGGGVWMTGTHVTGIDLATPATPVARPNLWFPGSGNVVTATERFLFVGLTDPASRAWWSSSLRIVDITDPTGVLREFATIPVGGRVQDKFKIHVNDDVLTVIAAGPENGEGGGRWRTAVNTYRLNESAPGTPQAWSKLGSVEVGHGENLFATRFDGSRAYIVTFERIDPLWIVDLSTPESPRVLGELEIPGWSTFIHPMGDRLLTVGIDNIQGSRVAVQLFDVANPAAPRLLAKVPLGEGWSYSEANETEKALGVFPEAGLVMVPFTSSSAAGVKQGVQLLDLGRDTLKARGLIASEQVVPRRTTLRGDRVLAVSSRQLVTVDIADRSVPAIRNVLELSYPVDRVLPIGPWVLEFTDTKVRVRHADGAGGLVAQHDLGAPSILGVASEGDHVFVLRGRAAVSEWRGNDWIVTSPSVATLSVFDARVLPELTQLGSVSAEGWEIVGTDYQPLWPRPGVLVWDAGMSHYPYYAWHLNLWPVDQGFTIDAALPGPGSAGTIRIESRGGPGFVFVDSGIPGGATPSLRFAGPAIGDFAFWQGPGIWWPMSSRDLLIFDVADPALPRAVSQVDSPENSIGRSDAYADDGKVFFSHDTYHQEVTGTNTVTYLSTEWVSEPREVLVTNIVRIPYEVPVTNVVEEIASVDGWIQTLPSAVAIEAGPYHALALSAAGELFGWGDNRAGQLGVGPAGRFTAEPIVLPGIATRVAATAWFNVAQFADGTVWSWGSPDGPARPPTPGADLPIVPGSEPRQIHGLPEDINDLSAGFEHVLARGASGALYAWGRNDRGQLGIGDLEDRSQPVRIADGIVTARGGGLHTLALTPEGRVLAWGEGIDGQLGLGSAEPSLTPREVPGLPAIQYIAAGDWHSLALDTSGTVWSWGGPTADSANPLGPPQPVQGLPTLRTMAAGRHHSIGLDESGSVWSWGTHAKGALLFHGLERVTQVSARGDYALALTENGVCHVWRHGQYPAPATLETRPLRMSRILGTNVIPGVVYRTETNVALKVINVGRWENVIVTNSYPVYRSWTRHHLNVIDLTSNPVEPVVRTPVSLPGPLCGISHQGELVYTLGTRADDDSNAVWRTWLEAGAYDGTAVHLVTTLEVANQSKGASAVAFVDPFGWVVLGRQDGMGTNSLTTLALNSDGRFVEFGSRRLESPSAQLELRDGLVAVSAASIISLFDLAADGSLNPVGLSFDLACLMPSLERLAGDRQLGLWAPLGEYGAAQIWRP